MSTTLNNLTYRAALDYLVDLIRYCRDQGIDYNEIINEIVQEAIERSL